MSKKVLETQFKFDVIGANEVVRTLNEIQSLAISNKLKTEAGILKTDLNNMFKQAYSAMESGTEAMAKISFDPVINKASAFIDKINKELVKEGILSPAVEAIESEIAEINAKIANGYKQIDQLEKAIAANYKSLDEQRKDPEHYGMTIPDNLSKTKALVAEIEKINQKLANNKTSDKVKEDLNQKLEAYSKYLVDLKKATEQEGKMRRQMGGYRSGVNQNEKKKAELETQKLDSAGLDEYNESVALLTQILKEAIQIREKFSDAKFTENERKQAEAIQKTEESVEQLNEAEEKLGKTKRKTIFQAISYYTIFNRLKKLISESIQIIHEFDRAMTEAAIVTTMTRKESWKLMETYQELAKETGKTIAEIASLNAFFLQQGMNLTNAAKMTEIAAKSAAIANITLQESANYLTSAINGFGLAASAAEEVADKFAAVGAATAANYEELAKAMSKVAPVAQSAGVSLDFMMGVLAKGIHTTREAPENIGTAFKTIFARMREITDLGKATEDGMSLNRVEKALETVNISLRDTSGQFRNLEDVIIELGYKWKDLDSIQQGYLATALAGTRQQPRLMAILNDFESTMEFIQISRDSAEAMTVQHLDYMGSMEAALNNMKTAWQVLIKAITDSDVIITVINKLTSALSVASNVIKIITDKAYLYIPILTAITPLIILQTASIIAKTHAKLRDARQTAMNNILDLAERINTKRSTKANIEEMASISAVTMAKEVQSKTTLRSIAIDKLKSLSLVNLGKAVWKALGPFGLLAGAIVGVVAVAKRFIKTEAQKAKQIEETNKQIKENNKLMHESKEKTTDLTKLIKDYNELANKIHKTNEELERMKELQSDLMNFNDGGDNIEFGSMIGNRFVIDEKKVREFYKKEYEKQATLMADNLKAAYKLNSNSNLAKVKNEVTLNEYKKVGQRITDSLLVGMEEGVVKNNISSLMDALIKGLTHGNVRTEFDDAYNYFKRSFDLAADFETRREAIVKSELTDPEKLNAELELYNELKAKAHFLGANSDFLVNSNQDLESLTQILDTLSTNNEFSIDIITKFKGSKDGIANLLQSFGIGDMRNSKQIIKKQEEVQKEILEREKLINEKNEELAAIASSNKKDKKKKKLSSPLIKEIAELEAENALSRSKLTSYSKSDLVLGDFFKKNTEHMTALFSDNPLLIAESAEAYFKYALSQGITEKEADKAYKNFLNGLTEPLSAGLERMKQQGGLASKLASFQTKMLEYDFSEYEELVDTFGSDAIKSYMKDNDFTKLFAGKKEEEIQALRTKLAQLRGGIQTEEVVKEIQAGEIMLSLLESNVHLAGLYAGKLAEAAGYANDMNAAFSNVSKFMELDWGFSEDVLDFLTQAGENSYEIAKQINQEMIDLAAQDFANIQKELEEAGVLVDGKIDVTADGYSSIMAEKYSQALEHLNKTVEDGVKLEEDRLQLEMKAYEKRKTAVETRYKAQIDGIKEYNSEKWKEYDYEQKISDLQEKIINARKQLMSASISNGRLSLEEARKNLETARMERQKEIEAQATAKMTKKLEEERDKTLKALEEKNIDSTQQLTSSITELINSITSKEGLLTAINDVDTTIRESYMNQGKEEKVARGGSASDSGVIHKNVLAW